MKKSFVFSLLMCILFLIPANAQVGNFLRNVKNNIKQEVIGTPDSKNTRPEPSCACDPAEQIIDLGKYKLDYTELNISVLADGSILLKENASSDYYISRNGTTVGPYKAGDPRIAQLQLPGSNSNDENEKDLTKLYKGYVFKSGDKYLITFNGKNYGPYSIISRFVVSLEKDKFAAVVTENVALTEDQGKKMEEAYNKAKTDDERMQLSIQYSQQMQQNMGSAGSQGLMPKFISNIPGVKIDDMATLISSVLYNNMKYNDIVMGSMGKIMDLQGNTILTYSNSDCDPESMYISSDNSRYACYKYGTLTFNDKKTLSELFNPHLIKESGKIFLAYMYYSPKKNALMQCKIPF
jgi:hypothetical protein